MVELAVFFENDVNPLKDGKGRSLQSKPLQGGAQMQGAFILEIGLDGLEIFANWKILSDVPLHYVMIIP